MNEWPDYDTIKMAFATAWCQSHHEYHATGDVVPCHVAQAVAGLPAEIDNHLMDRFMAALNGSGLFIVAWQDFTEDGKELTPLGGSSVVTPAGVNGTTLHLSDKNEGMAEMRGNHTGHEYY